MTDPTRQGSFVAEFDRITRSVPAARRAARVHVDDAQQAEETAKSRMMVAAAMLDDQRRWAAEQVNDLVTTADEGARRMPSEIDKQIASLPPLSLQPDARAGLQTAAVKAHNGLDGILAGGRDLLIWKARRSSIMGGIAIVVMLLLLAAGSLVARRFLAVRQAEAQATASAIVVTADPREDVGEVVAPEEASPAPTAKDDTSFGMIVEITPEQGGTFETIPEEDTALILEDGALSPSTPLPFTTSTPTVTSTPSPTAAPTEVQGPTVEYMQIGRTSRGTPIEAVRVGDGRHHIVFVGGMHAGFAPGTVALANQAVAHFTNAPDAVPNNVTLYIVVSASPDTPLAPGEPAGRLNSNRVDANRNWGCRWAQDTAFRGQVFRGSGGDAEFSEPEVAALRDFILDLDAVAVVFWEAKTEGGLVSPGSCDSRPATPLPFCHRARSPYPRLHPRPPRRLFFRRNLRAWSIRYA